MKYSDVFEEFCRQKGHDVTRWKDETGEWAGYLYMETHWLWEGYRAGFQVASDGGKADQAAMQKRIDELEAQLALTLPIYEQALETIADGRGNARSIALQVLTSEQRTPRKPIAWCFRKSLVQKLQWDKPIGGDNVLCHWTPLYE